MNELLLRAPCFGGRGFEYSQDLTLPEREWWARASATKTSRNLIDALKLVQDSRAGRYIRGFVLDTELALLDQEISGMVAQHHLLFSAPSKFSSAMLLLDQAERDKLKSQMLMERCLLLSCTESSPLKNTSQRQRSVKATMASIEPRVTAQKIINEKARPVAAMSETRMEPRTTPKIIDEKARPDVNMSETSMGPQTTPKIIDEKARPDVDMSETSMEPQTTPKIFDEKAHPDVDMSETSMGPQTTPKIIDEKARPDVDMSETSMEPQTTPKIFDEKAHPDVDMSETSMEPQTTPKIIDEKARPDVDLSEISISPKVVTAETTCSVDVVSHTSFETPIVIQKKKIGLKKRARTFFAKICRSIAGGCCCGMRRAAEE